ncbi:MAG: alkaline phosphatase, partial [Chloroflexi bacterium]|nr:alkaline phosphatase [Chloroflexota bacterium]
DANGKLDKEKGMREFVVGTGGKDLYNIPQPIPNLEAFNFTSFGVIKFTLRAASYEWQFIPVEGQTFKDEGKDTCH